jgi:hypothetical protein
MSLAALLVANPVSAQDSGQGLSQALVDKMTALALTTIPSEVKKPDGTVLKIDKEDLSKLVVPLEDRRRVIRVARLSAQASLCNLQQLQAQNYLTMMRQEKAKDKWSEQQLLFINRLHLFTVMLLSGNIKTVDKEDGSEEVQIIADAEQEAECSDEERTEVQSRIETYLKSAKKS